MDNRIDQCQGNNIEALSKWLRLLRITEEDTLEEITEIESIDEMSIAPAPVVYNKQIVMPKSMVPDPG